MYQLRFTAFLVLLTTYLPCSAQYFVNTDSRWHVNWCCVNWVAQQMECDLTEYKLEPTQTVINGKSYNPLKTLSGTGNGFGLEAFFREEDGKVFRLDNNSSSEVMIYDFNLVLGDTVQIGDPVSFTYPLVVSAVDSITLLSGEKKRRMKMNIPGPNEVFTYWIDGIGCTNSPLDTRYSFMMDCWYGLACFYQNNQLVASFGDACAPTVSTQFVGSDLAEYVTFAPNPARGYVTIQNTSNHQVMQVWVSDMLGSLRSVAFNPASQQVEVSGLPAGIYAVLLQLDNGQMIQTRLMVL